MPNEIQGDYQNGFASIHKCSELFINTYNEIKSLRMPHIWSDYKLYQSKCLFKVKS